MFISRKELLTILERLDRLETIVASATGYNVEELKELRQTRHGTRCLGSSFGDHNFSGSIGGGYDSKGKSVNHAYCVRCGQILGG